MVSRSRGARGSSTQGWSPGWKCLVATAAVGSPYAPQVAALRRARCQFRNLSEWTGLISGPVLEAYARFSPAIVLDMGANPALKDAVLTYAVQPVFHLVHMVETYLGADSDGPALLADLDRSIDQYVADVTEAGGPALALQVAATAASLTGRQVGSDRKSAPVAPGGLQMPRDLFRYLASAITSSGGETTGFAWAFEGLGLFLRQAAAKLGEAVSIAPDFPHAFGAWLRAPIPPGARLNVTDARPRS